MARNKNRKSGFGAKCLRQRKQELRIKDMNRKSNLNGCVERKRKENV
jgi:hypothetical protein